MKRTAAEQRKEGNGVIRVGWNWQFNPSTSAENIFQPNEKKDILCKKLAKAKFEIREKQGQWTEEQGAMTNKVDKGKDAIKHQKHI